MPTVHVVSLGCPKNLVDTENMLGILESKGYTLCDSVSQADVVLINTCGFIEPAKREALSEIVRAIRAKQRRPRLKIVVAGCFVQRYGELLQEEFTEIDGLVGVHDIDKIDEVIESALDGKRKVYVSSSTSRPAGARKLRVLTTPAHMAYLKISEGCDNRCTYCAIPLIRGPMVSRPIDELVSETEALALLGVKEVVVVAQDPTRYGLDIAGKHLLPELCRAIGKVQGVEWIRLMYAHPARADVLRDALLADKVCRYADIPVQHASESVLRRMGRTGSGEEYLRKIEEIREDVPGISLRSTFMVGFPGETDRDFEYLLEFIRQARFEHAGVFKYSPEEGTAGAEMPGAVDPELVQERYDEAVTLQEEVSRNEAAKRVGTRARTIIERPVRDGYIGRTEFQAPEIDGITKVSAAPGSLQAGDMIDCELTAISGHDFTAIQKQSK